MIGVVGYFLAFLMGIILGLTGAGGGILTVPILVYLFKLKPAIATGYSLLIVGTLSVIATTQYWKNRQSDLWVALFFAFPSMLTMLLTRAFILPAVPEVLLKTSHFVLHKDIMIMVLFASMMLTAGTYMLHPRTEPDESQIIPGTQKISLVFVISSLIGLLTGIVGAGGGFIIVPLLISFFNFPVKIAVGTSLAIVSINALIGFTGDLIVGISMDWAIVIPFLLLSLLGIFLGVFIAQKTHPHHIRKFFGAFIMLIGIIILISEVNLLFSG